MIGDQGVSQRRKLLAADGQAVGQSAAASRRVLPEARYHAVKLEQQTRGVERNVPSSLLSEKAHHSKSLARSPSLNELTGCCGR